MLLMPVLPGWRAHAHNARDGKANNHPTPARCVSKCPYPGCPGGRPYRPVEKQPARGPTKEQEGRDGKAADTPTSKAGASPRARSG